MTALDRAIAVVREKLDQCWTPEEAIDWAAQAMGVSRAALVTAVAEDCGDAAYD
jgi:hypothetical protein